MKSIKNFNFYNKLKTNQKYFIWFVFLLCFLNPTCFAQSEPTFKKIDQYSGLSNGRVGSIIKEKNGYVWIGTSNGLNRYDGYTIKVYNKQNSSLNANNISDLFLDSKSRIWVGTLGGGLNLYNASEDTFIAYEISINNSKSIASNEINTIFEDSKGNLWIGTQNGLSLYDEIHNEFITYKHDNNTKSISHNDVRSIYEDINGVLWIGTFGGGLNRFNPETHDFKHIKPTMTISSNFIHVVAGLDKDKILIGTNGEGLLVFDVNSLQFLKKELKSEEVTNIVRCIKKDSNGSIWIGTDGNGLFKLEDVNSQNPQVYNYTYNSQLESSISSNAIYHIMEDEDSNIWIGTAWNGINVLNQNNEYELLTGTVKGEAPSPVLSVYKSRTQCLLGLDGEGLSIIEDNGTTIERYGKDNKKSIGGNYIQHIKKGSNQTFWIGTFVNGLINFNPKTGTFLQYIHEPENTKSLSYNNVRYVIEDDIENLWVATWGGGLNYFNTKNKAFKSFQNQPEDSLSISNNNIISIQKEGDSLWLATFGGGINLFDTRTKQSKHYRYSESSSNSISSDYVYSILKDSKNNLWVGTSGEGINLYNKKTGKINRFEKNENIRYQTITAIIEDNNGLIWFSTKKGIFNYDYNTDSFKSFTNLSGEYHINAVFKDENGLLYFGGSKGVIMFKPETILTENINPNVKLTSFKLFNKEVPIGENEILKKDILFTENITLKHDLDVITFEFAAMQFPSSTNCEYAIKLENFDKEWRYIGKDRTVTYTNLSSGNYTFKVKSKTLGSNWTEENTSVKLKILKPFWLEWWAFLIYGIITIVLLYLFRKYTLAWERLKTNLKLQRLTHEKDTELYNFKQRFFTNISHEIRTPVTLILSSVKRLIDAKAVSDNRELKPINIIENNSNHLLNLVNELLDFRSIEDNEIKLKVTQNDWVKFSNEIYLAFTEKGIEKNIEYSFETLLPFSHLWFDKNQMEKVIYNLLSNAFKFTEEGGTIKLTLTEKENHVLLTITDTGVGISKNQLIKVFDRFYKIDNSTGIQESGFGLGLSISQEIVKLHHGEIIAQSKKGKGSTFVVKLLKGKEHFNSESIITEDSSDSELIKNYFEDYSTKEDIAALADISEIKNQTLLIVEDNNDIRNYLVEMFSDKCKILEASNGQEALKLVLKEMPDLIISDVMMPVMDGIEFTHKIKKDVKTSHIPIILLTALASFTHKIQGFDTGADDYITKPFSEAILRVRIKNLLKNRAALRKRFSADGLILPNGLAINQRDQDFLEKLTHIIHENIDSNVLNANYLAFELAMSHSVIYKKIKALTGLSLVEFVRDYKLKIAKKLIEEQSYSVVDACYKVGYSDRKYFSKLFKIRFGKNPSDFIKK
ncbi:two-component regulator propeller domain-containing protein [Aureibaculum sp. 2210JD6-5]|uniref:hybrid sensor histidine kinase/response regulator transcription factor n=1 Tax=Aureibaculum sp. 2210JD6-5 TaxID=3103957 RepID=UPI002AADC735|nr:two-component regulator propeller domain-containing protein [Aureibaculum sp. 2210JD6-5]MDY7396309.1 two-component regulator propeller domain-containing protein [Aureibaculum sp. 2210JD6-5]